MANRAVRAARSFEDALAFLSVFALAVLLLVEVVTRRVLNKGLRNSTE